MNITDIFFNIGEWNWDAISTFFLGILVLVTLCYAKQVKKQTELMEKERVRNKILERIQQLSTPYINNIKKEIDEITNGTKIHFGQYFNIFFDGKRYRSYAFEDIIEESTNLPKKLHSNDEFADKLNTSYDEIEKEVTNQFKNNKFNERLTNMLKPTFRTF